MKHRSFDFFGNVVLVKFPRDTKKSERISFARNLMKQNKAIKTVLEKTGKFSGRLRKPETRHLAGEKTKEVLYRENDCVFRFNIDEAYFSPRLSSERKDIASKIKKGESVLVMFAGVAPYPIVIAKKSQASRIFSNEINRKANEYAKLNLRLNKLTKKVELAPGDIKRVAKKFAEQKQKFDVIVMPRPQLKDSFLASAFSLSKKGTRIYYYGFCKIEDIKLTIKKIKEEAKKAKKKIRILKTQRAGEIAPYKIRLRVDLKVL